MLHMATIHSQILYDALHLKMPLVDHEADPCPPPVRSLWVHKPLPKYTSSVLCNAQNLHSILASIKLPLLAKGIVDTSFQIYNLGETL